MADQIRSFDSLEEFLSNRKDLFEEMLGFLSEKQADEMKKRLDGCKATLRHADHFVRKTARVPVNIPNEQLEQAHKDKIKNLWRDPEPTPRNADTLPAPKGKLWQRMQKKTKDASDEAKSVAGRVTWKSDDADILQKRVSRSRDELMDVINTCPTAEDIQAKYERIHRWIAPLNCEAEYYKLCEGRIEGPGERLVASTAFKEFETQTHVRGRRNTLLYMDKPGTGKSVLATVVIDKLSETSEQHHATAVAYLFCEWNSPRKQTTQDLVGSVLSQLIRSGKKRFPLSLKKKYTNACKRSANQDNLPPLPFLDLRREMESFLSTLRAFVVVDALDECPESLDFLEIMSALQTTHDVRILATSRNVRNIPEQLPDHILVDVHAGQEDTALFIVERLKCMAKNNRIFSAALQNEIKEGLSAVSGGMFQLAKIYLETWSDMVIKDQVIDALQVVKSGDILAENQVYKDAYGTCMQRIMKQSKERVDLATLVFAWAVFGTRPLTGAELREALCLHYSLRSPTKDDLDDLMNKASSVCCGLVELQGSTGVRLAHKTAQEYFERFQKTDQAWLSNAEALLAATCLSALWSSTPNLKWVWKICGLHRTIYKGKDEQPRQRDEHRRATPKIPLRSSEMRFTWGRSLDLDLRVANKAKQPAQPARPPLIEYAKLNWWVHVRQAQQARCWTSELEESLSGFLRSDHFSNFEGYIEHTVELQHRRGPRRNASSRRAQASTSTRLACHDISAVHLAAYFGFHNAVVELTQHGWTDLIDTTTRDGITPLLCAIIGGHLRTVKYLVEKGAELTTKFPVQLSIVPSALRTEQPAFHKAHHCATWATQVGLQHKLGPNSYQEIAEYLRGKYRESQSNEGNHGRESWKVPLPTFRRRPTE